MMLAIATTMCVTLLTVQVTPLPGPTAKFDPTRDAAADIRAAVAEARRTNRRVILDVGGEWCPWCHTLDRFYAADAELQRLRDTYYVWLKVNFSTENKNDQVLRNYPLIKGYPHLFVLDREGKVVQSQDTAALERGSSYDGQKMREFLQKWAGR